MILALVIIAGAEEQVRQERPFKLDHYNINVGRHHIRIHHAYRWKRVPDCSGLKRIRIRRVVDDDFKLPRAVETLLVLNRVDFHTPIKDSPTPSNDRGPPESIGKSQSRSEIIVVPHIGLSVIAGAKHKR